MSGVFYKIRQLRDPIVGTNQSDHQFITPVQGYAMGKKYQKFCKNAPCRNDYWMSAPGAHT